MNFPLFIDWFRPLRTKMLRRRAPQKWYLNGRRVTSQRSSLNQSLRKMRRTRPRHRVRVTVRHPQWPRMPKKVSILSHSVYALCTSENIDILTRIGHHLKVPRYRCQYKIKHVFLNHIATVSYIVLWQRIISLWLNMISTMLRNAPNFGKQVSYYCKYYLDANNHFDICLCKYTIDLL